MADDARLDAVLDELRAIRILLQQLTAVVTDVGRLIAANKT